MTEEDDGADAPTTEHEIADEDTTEHEIADEDTTEHGITDEDMERIAAFLEMPQYERTVDDLRPLSKNQSPEPEL